VEGFLRGAGFEDTITYVAEVPGDHSVHGRLVVHDQDYGRWFDVWGHDPVRREWAGEMSPE
jgi:hypothetical protein